MRDRKVIKRRIEWRVIVIPITLVAAIVWFGYFMVNMPSAEERNTNKMEYTTTVVRRGDTLWSIARDNYDSSRDIRETVYYIRKLNNLKSELIRPGQVIRIPIYE